MFKKSIAVLLVQVVFASSAFAISFKRNSKFYFLDKEGEQMAYLECSNLNYNDEIMIQKIISRAEKQELEIESLNIKKQKLAITYNENDITFTQEIETKLSYCELKL